MKIRQKRWLNLADLINWVYDNNDYGIYIVKDTDSAYVEIEKEFINIVHSKSQINNNSLFEIEEEIEVYKNTRLDRILVIMDNKNAPCIMECCSINRALKLSEHNGFIPKFIYIQNEDGSIGELIWSHQ